MAFQWTIWSNWGAFGCLDRVGSKSVFEIWNTSGWRQHKQSPNAYSLLILLLAQLRRDNLTVSHGQLTICWRSTTSFFPLFLSLEAVQRLPGNHSCRSLNCRFITFTNMRSLRFNVMQLQLIFSEPIAVVGEMFLAGSILGPIFLKRWHLV